jgi:K+-dependent Na+/Ca+ exchanger-like protein
MRATGGCIPTALAIALAWTSLHGTPPVSTDDGGFSASPRELHEPLDEECIGGITRVRSDDVDKITLLTVSSERLTTINCPADGASAVCLKEEYRGYIVFYLLGVVYMFIALAIVCDEFFVPSLEAFVDHFEISMDVAGATFMAAGGSMPELFTSFIATFQESDVGFAAIVGSAVFNVLFVIAVCAIASEEVLALTWWPLARDCFFYVMCLLTVALFFGGISKKEIEWWEASLLLCEYLVYCCFMKHNGIIQDWVIDRLKNQRKGSHKVEPVDTISSGDTAEVPKRRRSSRAETPSNLNFTKPSMFRKGIIQVLTQNAYVYETAGIAVVTQVKGTLEEKFKQLDKDGDGFLDEDDVKELLLTLGVKHDSAAIATAVRRIIRSGEGKISFDAFKKWYIASEARVEVEVRRVFDKFDKDGSGTIERDEIEGILRTLGHKPDRDAVNGMMREIMGCGPTDSSGGDAAFQGVCVSEEEANTAYVDGNGTMRECKISFEQFDAWYSKSLFWQKQHHQHLQEENAEEEFNLDMVENPTVSTLFWYVVTYPLCAMMYCTVPDVRREKWQRNVKVAIVAFILSLCWIAIFSNFLYEWTVVSSCTLGIPPPVAAVTVLAAGTSIPDLLSSYIVARQGEGDMAVSSSIGSNIFDVTVGLPLPWLCFNIIRGKSVQVQSESLFFSILILILMLVAVVGSVKAMNWRMTKNLGYVMLALYVIFVTENLMQQFGVYRVSW